LETFNEISASQNYHYVSIEADVLFDFLIKYFTEKKEIIKVDEGCYKIVLRPNDFEKMLHFSLQIFRVDDDLNVIEFQKMKGSLFAFYTQIGIIIDKLFPKKQEKDN